MADNKEIRGLYGTILTEKPTTKHCENPVFFLVFSRAS